MSGFDADEYVHSVQVFKNAFDLHLKWAHEQLIHRKVPKIGLPKVPCKWPVKANLTVHGRAKENSMKNDIQHI